MISSGALRRETSVGKDAHNQFWRYWRLQRISQLMRIGAHAATSCPDVAKSIAQTFLPIMSANPRASSDFAVSIY